MGNVPWFIGGSDPQNPVLHPAEVARLLPYALAGGAEGVVEPGDLKVSPLVVPGTSVRVAPGGCLVRNRYPGGSQQSYGGRFATEQTIPIAATGSSGGRSDLVVARILDPQYEGQQPANPNDFDYLRLTVVQGVPAGTTSARERNLGYPAIALARIDLPASTGTVTAAMVKDLRRLASPRTHRSVQLVKGGAQADLTSTSYVFFPPSGNGVNSDIWVDVPEWATHAVVRMDLNSVAHVAPNFIGDLRVKLHQTAGPDVSIDLDLSAGAEHVNQSVWADLDVRSLAGQRVRVALEGRRWSGYTGRLRTRPQTQYVVDVQFEERGV